MTDKTNVSYTDEEILEAIAWLSGQPKFLKGGFARLAWAAEQYARVRAPEAFVESVPAQGVLI